jgi:hypothetical protein
MSRDCIPTIDSGTYPERAFFFWLQKWDEQWQYDQQRLRFERGMDFRRRSLTAFREMERGSGSIFDPDRAAPP